MTRLAGAQVCVLVALLGALAGIGIAVATDVVSRTSVGGQNWSLRGNGALVVMFAGLPAVLAGGWASLARWRLRDWRWGTAGMGVGAVALVAAGVASFGPVLVVNALGQEALRGGDGHLVAIGATFFAPPVVAFVCGLGAAVWLGRLTRVAASAELLLFALVIALILSPWRGAYFIVGPLAAVPTLASLPVLLMRTSRAPLFGWGWLVAACGALAVGVVAGVLAAQWLQQR